MSQPLSPVVSARPAVSGPRHRDHGLTLVEIMVVMVIISVLVTIMLTGTHAVKEYARMTACLANMHNMALANHGYATDNRQRIPGPNWGWNEPGWLYSTGEMKTPDDLKSGQLWEYTRDERVYRCPSDDADWTKPWTFPNPHRNSRMITSYCMNGSACGYGSRRKDSGPDGRTYWFTYRMTEFRASDVFYWEADETVDDLGWWHDGANFPWEGMTKRHNDNGSVVCADGHVEFMTKAEYYEAGRSWWSIKHPTRLWNTPNSESGYRENGTLSSP